VVRRGIAPSAEAARPEVASRTDKGVSARGNALTLSSALPPSALLRALNAIAPDIFFTGLAPVVDSFRVRSAEERWYRYIVPSEGRSLPTWKNGAALFHGPVDVRSFGRGFPGNVPQSRPLRSVEVVSDPPWLRVDVRAASFVWGMVRKIVGALAELDAGRVTLRDLEDAINGRRRLTLPLAEPQALVLWEVRYAMAWTHHWSGPNRHQAALALRIERAARTQLRLIEALRENPRAPRTGAPNG
jgi:tRNA pseudouridine38-40 synthase